MKIENSARSAGDILNSRIGGVEPLFASDGWGQLILSMKLAELEERWDSVAGAAIAKKSKPVACEYSGDAIRLTVNTADSMALTAIKFRRYAMERRAENLLGAECVKIDFRVGSVAPRIREIERASTRKRRRISLCDEEILSEQKNFEEAGLSEELARSMAKVKLTIEKLSKRD